jgi:hypothetical protein
VLKGDNLTTFIVTKVEKIQEPETAGTPKAIPGLKRKTFT